MATRSWHSLRNSGRLRAIRLLIDARPQLAACLGLLTFGSVVATILSRVFLGLMVGRVPGVIQDGLGSHAGDRLLLYFFLAGACYTSSLLVPPLEDALGTAVKARLTNSMQARLMAAVCAPSGTAHVENPLVLDRLALAQGSLMTYAPAGAPVVLAREPESASTASSHV